MTRALAVVPVVLLLAGCGGGDISKAEFVKKANKVCKDGNKEVEKAGESIGDNPSADDVAKAVKDKVVPAVQDQFDEIRDLGFPKADKAKLEKIFDDSQGVLDKVKDNPVKALNSGNPFGDINDRLKDYGLTACGS